MGLSLFMFMIVVPILEIAVFIVVGRSIGLWPTLIGILATALIGSMIIRHQGIGIVAKARRSLAAGEAPVGEVLEGLALVVAGAFLITPGFITDTLGFILLVPRLRRAAAGAMLTRAVRRGAVRVHMSGGSGGTAGDGTAAGARGPDGRGRRGGGKIIEGEWTELDDRPERQDRNAPPAPGRGWERSGADHDDQEHDPPPRPGSAGG